MNVLKRGLAGYFGSWWIPSALSLVLLAAAGGFEFAGAYRFAAVSGAFGLAFPVSLLGVVAAALWNFVLKRWRRGFLNLLGLPVCFVAMLAVAFLCMFGPSEDGFADNLTIPTGLEISDPLPASEPAPYSTKDPFQKAILDALEIEGPDDTKITACAPSLVKLARENPRLLHRYLASSAAWRVYEDNGKHFATRRWRIGGDWKWNLHGYYTQFDPDPLSKDKRPDFQTRLTLGLDGKPWFENGATTRVTAGATAPLELRKADDRDASHCVVESEPVAIEIFEERDGKERRLTKASLAELEKELAPLAANPSWEAARTSLPEGSITHGTPSLELRSSRFGGGIYDAIIRANPGEPGRIYLKAFEVTKGTPLSKNRLKEGSMEWIGWSESPDEQFLSNTHITIYEGDWGKHYAARFEVWFIPDSGAPERKLLGKNFKIEGWMR